jgi:hypothetical protein
MEYYQPIMIMVLIQFIYSGMTLGTRIGLLEGMSPRVFVVYRHAFATIFIAPIAYLSGYLLYFLLCYFYFSRMHSGVFKFRICNNYVFK